MAVEENIDARLENADWTKQAWDLPDYKSDEFNRLLRSWEMTLDEFKSLPVYKLAVANGLIVDDEWAG